MPKLKIHTVPVPAPRMTRADRWKKRPCVLRYFDCKDNYRLGMKKGYELPGKGLSLEFHLPMSKSWSEKKKLAHDGQPHQQKPDLDNLIKTFKDSFGEDSHVHEYGTMRKVWSRTGKVVILSQ